MRFCVAVARHLFFLLYFISFLGGGGGCLWKLDFRLLSDYDLFGRKKWDAERTFEVRCINLFHDHEVGLRV